MAEDIPFPSSRILIFIWVEFIIFRKRSTKKTVVTIHFLLGCRVSKINKKKKERKKTSLLLNTLDAVTFLKGSKAKAART